MRILRLLSSSNSRTSGISIFQITYESRASPSQLRQHHDRLLHPTARDYRILRRQVHGHRCSLSTPLVLAQGGPNPKRARQRQWRALLRIHHRARPSPNAILVFLLSKIRRRFELPLIVPSQSDRQRRRNKPSPLRRSAKR